MEHMQEEQLIALEHETLSLNSSFLRVWRTAATGWQGSYVQETTISRVTNCRASCTEEAANRVTGKPHAEGYNRPIEAALGLIINLDTTGKALRVFTCFATSQ